MKKKIVRRFAAIASATVLAVGACAMLAGCTSSNPEVTITYSFNDQTYAVKYKLSRSDAPKTVQHFIELADAGYYDGTCIHDYDSNFLYGGGYYFDENNVLTEKDYFAVVKELEEAGNSFTQTVYTKNGNTPLYTVYGEFFNNGVQTAGSRENVHSKGALVMYYTDKTDSAKNIEVSVSRNDGGKNNDGETNQYQPYATNSATSLFYTFLGVSNSSRDNNYAVFGKTVDFNGELQPLLDAIQEYKSTLEDDENTEEDESSFTTEFEMILDTLDHTAATFGEDIADIFESVRKGGTRETYNTPHDMPIIITSVVVNKY